jgi:hypothetical protein
VGCKASLDTKSEAGHNLKGIIRAQGDGERKKEKWRMRMGNAGW